MLGNYIASVPAQQRVGKHWFLGSADAIYQSLNLLDDERPDYVVITGADNIYRMDFSQMVDHHIASGLPLTVASIRQPKSLANQFGVIETDPENRGKIKAFVEKPSSTPGLPDSPNEVLASMGNYVFNADALKEAVTLDAANEDSKHDMGGNIIPWFVERGECGVYDFQDNDVPGSTDRDRDYWRDVGTLDAYYEANMDLISVHPVFNLYNREWPTMTMIDGSLPPAKFVYGDADRLGHAIDSFVSPGVIVSGGEIVRSVISPNTYVHSWAKIEDSVVMHGCRIGRSSRVVKTILDKNVLVEEGAVVGVDLDHDRERGFTVTESGITVVPKGTVVRK